MPADFKRSFERVLAAREDLLAARTKRVAQLERLNTYVRTKLADFMSGIDPIGGSRFVEMGLEGNKTLGDMAFVVAFLDGTRLKIAIDGEGRFTHLSEPDVFGRVGTIVDLDVSDDGSLASIKYLPAGAQRGDPNSADFETYLEALVQHVVASIEGEHVQPRAAATNRT
ncbi:MAG: hypothetical protein GIW95_10745 [Candidatus Eremiobacteraeota bacterium]|nr:hypothetical protein [Candidatus Eremiobacteraeota bacterium]